MIFCHKTPVLLLQNEDTNLTIMGGMFSEIGVAKFAPDYLRHKGIMYFVQHA